MNVINKDDHKSLVDIELPMIDTWDEKEEPLKEGEEPPEGKKKAGKKKAKGKKQKKGEDEEPSGPQWVVFEQDLGPFRITNDFARTLSTKQFRLQIINKEK